MLMKLQEVTGFKPLTPDQQRIKAMKDRVKRDQEAVKAERARQTIKAAEIQLSKAQN
jgi:hypothetical protein